MKIYTKTGDQGETGLFSGQRVSKTHSRVAAYGTLDELNSHLGVAAASHPAPEVAAAITSLQSLLFELGSDLATILKTPSAARITPEHIGRLEQEMDSMMAVLPPLRAFLLPGGSPAAAQIHVARAVCRRAEREAIEASQIEEIPADALIFLNRLSDYLFVLARYENLRSGHAEPEWVPA